MGKACGADDSCGGTCAPCLSWTMETVDVGDGGPPVGDMELVSIWGTGSSDIFAVSEGFGGGIPGVILHSTGDGTWTPQVINDGSDTVDLSFALVWGDAAGDMFVVGTDQSGCTGVIFTPASPGMWAPFSDAGGGCQFFAGVWGSPGDLYTSRYATSVGSTGSILHATQGASWSTETSLDACSYTSIWGTSASDIYATGACTESGPFMQHSTGNGTWSTEALPFAGSGSLTAFWGSSPSDIYAVGSGGVVVHSSGNGSWTQQAAGSSPSVNLWGIWGSGPSDVYVAADDGVYHSTGDGTWAAIPIPGLNNAHGVWGASSSDVYVVGNAGVIAHGHP
jgi:hypothetical protein